MGSVAGDGEVAVVHLVDDEVGRGMGGEPMVISPAFRVGLTQVYDSTALSVDTDGLGEDARCVTASDVKGIELSLEVALDGGFPTVFTVGTHNERVGRLGLLR